MGNGFVTFTAKEANSTIGLERISTTQTFEYSTDNATWNVFDTSVTITLSNIGDEVYVRGVLSGHNNLSDYTRFKMTGLIAASGNCNALWNYNELDASLKVCCGLWMFFNCTSLTTAPQLPSERVQISCYSSMFENCTSLTTAPELPATTLVNSCYESMFRGCTSLTTAPELPATTLVDSCYSNMFYDCTSLNYIKCLATDISASYCTYNWVSNVASEGVFEKNNDMDSWTIGADGIPDNWTIADSEPLTPQDIANEIMQEVDIFAVPFNDLYETCLSV